MANVLVISITKSNDGTQTVLKGASLAGATVTVKSGNTTLAQVQANTEGQWECSFASTNSSVTVSVGGKNVDVTLDANSGEVSYPSTPATQITLTVQLATVQEPPVSIVM